MDREGTILWVNPSAEHTLGHGKLGLIGSRLPSHLHAEDAGLVMDTFGKVGSHPDLALACDFRLRNARSQWLNMECTFTNLLHDPAVGCIVAAMQDITRHSLAANALRDAETKYHRIFENAIEGIFQSTPEGHYLSVNPSLARIYGFDTPEEMIDSVTDIARQVYVDPERRARFLELMETSDTLTGFESQVRRKDGSVIWISENVRAVRRSDGRSLYYEGTVEDVTKRRQAEEALRVSEERYALAADGMNGGLWDWDLRTGKVYYSPRWKELTGEPGRIGDSPEEWWVRLFPRDREQVDRELQSCLQGRTDRFEVEFRFRQADGSFRWVQASGMAQSDDPEKPPVRIAGSMVDISARKQAEDQLLQGALYDVLTGLPNRALFVDRLRRALRKRGRRIVAVLFLDIDRFKLVNESYGHQVGDEVLRQIASRLERNAGVKDTVARFSGDEFGILLDGAHDVSDAIRTADLVRRSVEEPVQVEDRKHTFSASVGIAFSKVGTESAEELLRDAETAMYRAKSLGKAQHVLFDQAMHEYTLRRLQLESDLQRAVGRSEFRVFYQPIVSLSDHKLRGFEALVRWMHPERGMVPPTAFIPLAEETGLICEIGRWVLEDSCRQVADWIRRYPEATEGLHLSVNLSGRQFAQSDLVDQVQGALDRSGFPALSLKLEITESILMENADSAAGILAQIRDMGIRLSIDDFGTGYSSLSYLHQFPAQTLKIDRSFVCRIEEETSQLAIVRAVVSLAHVMGMDVVAEGIETPSQLDVLTNLGCEYGQGYLFARPLPAVEIEAMLARDSEAIRDLADSETAC
jgi:diguanylate cyclase (GGDEF)-like protein/PAS domain S-box-containing protein